MSTIKSRYESQLTDLQRKLDRAEFKVKEHSMTVKQILCEVDNKDQIITEKDTKISYLQRELGEMQQDLREVSGDFLFNCRDLRKHQYLGILSNLEKEKCELLDQIDKLNMRLNRERETIGNLQNLVEKQRLKNCRLDAKLREYFTLN